MVMERAHLRAWIPFLAPHKKKVQHSLPFGALGTQRHGEPSVLLVCSSCISLWQSVAAWMCCYYLMAFPALPLPRVQAQYFWWLHFASISDLLICPAQTVYIILLLDLFPTSF
jgi:hypothetical protein